MDLWLKLMKISSLLSIFSVLVPLSKSINTNQSICEPWKVDTKTRIFVLSDISNEPDDTMSFVRLLLHSDMYHIEGMVAVTSYWLNSSTYPDQIKAAINAYGQAYDNLQSHAHEQYPSEEYLLSRVASGPTVYGLRAIESLASGSNISSGSHLLIDVIDSSDQPLYIEIWGGANCLAEALWYINLTRSTDDESVFESKLRVYSISDQDNTGHWIRRNFPLVRWTNSIHGWNQYGLATWSGISGDAYYAFDVGGPDTSLVTNAWIKQHFQIGPLGHIYPDIAYIMEGDSPSLLFNMQNGLNAPEHPEWGGWGGRYTLSDLVSNHYSDTADRAIGLDGAEFVSNHATIWRWRRAYQFEMAARIQWQLSTNEPGSNATHPPIVVVNGSCGSAPIEVEVKPNSTITFDARGSYDPDHPDQESSLTYKWWHYREITATQWSVALEVPQLNFTLNNAPHGRVASVKLPAESEACKPVLGLTPDGPEVCQQYHVILEVTNSAPMPLTRYRRIILKVQGTNTTLTASAA